MFKVEIKPSLDKQIEKIPKPYRIRILEKIKEFSNDPFPYNSVKLSGMEKKYRVRLGDYRIVYGVELDLKLVTVHFIGHRSDIYRRL